MPQPVTDAELRNAAIRTLRHEIIRKLPPGERRDRFLARREVMV